MLSDVQTDSPMLQFCLWSCHWAPLEVTWLSFLHTLPSAYVYTSMRFPLQPPLPPPAISRLNSPSSLSLSSQEICSRALIIFVRLRGTLWYVTASLVQRSPGLDAVLQGWPHQRCTEGKEPLPRPAGSTLAAAQDPVSSLCCELTLLASTGED